MSGHLFNQSRLNDRTSAGSIAIKKQIDRRFVDSVGRSRISATDAMGAALAHELNQPLAALTIYLQSVQRQFGKNSDLVDGLASIMLEKAIGEAQRATEIVRRMRRFSTFTEPEQLPINLNAIADESIELSLVGLQSVPVVERHYDQGLPVVIGDPVQVRQIIVNLVCNAVDATTGLSKPQLTVSTHMQNGFVHFIILDNGPGIDQRVSDTLFKAFESRKPNGMGLGLAISRIIAQNHGGDLLLKSEGGTSGACFDLKLPVTRAHIDQVSQ